MNKKISIIFLTMLCALFPVAVRSAQEVVGALSEQAAYELGKKVIQAGAVAALTGLACLDDVSQWEHNQWWREDHRVTSIEKTKKLMTHVAIPMALAGAATYLYFDNADAIKAAIASGACHAVQAVGTGAYNVASQLPTMASCSKSLVSGAHVVTQSVQNVAATITSHVPTKEAVVAAGIAFASGIVPATQLCCSKLAQAGRYFAQRKALLAGPSCVQLSFEIPCDYEMSWNDRMIMGLIFGSRLNIASGLSIRF